MGYNYLPILGLKIVKTYPDIFEVDGDAIYFKDRNVCEKALAFSTSSNTKGIVNEIWIYTIVNANFQLIRMKSRGKGGNLIVRDMSKISLDSCVLFFENDIDIMSKNGDEYVYLDRIKIMREKTLRDIIK